MTEPVDTHLLTIHLPQDATLIATVLEAVAADLTLLGYSTWAVPDRENPHQLLVTIRQEPT